MKSKSSAFVTLRGVARLIRPFQWTKNGFVLAGFIFARQWDDADLLSRALFAFVGFCAAASAAYVYNDLHDIESDRAHPVKRHRPLAAGQVTQRTAALVGAAMVLLSLVCGWAAGAGALASIAAYLALNAIYSRWLKHVVIADVFSVAAGFMLRLLAGTAGIGIPPSDWLILTGLFLTLFLGFAKRRAEWSAITNTGGTQRRRVMSDYTAQLLDSFLAVTATAAILGYGLYTVDPGTRALHGTTHLVYTLPFVTFAMFRYLYLVHKRGQGEDPSRDLFADGQLLVCAFCWLVATAWLIY